MTALPLRPIKRLGRSARQRLFGRWRNRWTYRLPVEGAVFVFVTLLIGLAAVNTTAQLLYLVFGVLCAFWVLSDLMATSSMTRIRVERRIPRVVTARQPVEVSITIENRKRLWNSFSLRVEDFDDTGTRVGAGFFARVSAGAKATESYTCVFPRRGVYRFSKLGVSTRFPFGLIERKFASNDPAEVLVVPPVISLERMMKTARTELGYNESRHKGRGSNLYGIREYTEGEPSRDIHWKLSARANALLVREFESEDRRRSTVILDNRLSLEAGKEERESLEHAIVLAASLVDWLIAHGHEVELATSTGRVPFSAGSPQKTRCLRALALLKPEPPNGSSPWSCVSDPDSVRFVVVFGTHKAPPDTIEMNVAIEAEALSRAVAREIPDLATHPPPTFEDVRRKAAKPVSTEPAP